MTVAHTPLLHGINRNDPRIFERAEAHDAVPIQRRAATCQLGGVRGA